MTGRDIVVIGASAGGIAALCDVVGGLPANLPATLSAETMKRMTRMPRGAL